MPILIAIFSGLASLVASTVRSMLFAISLTLAIFGALWFFGTDLATWVIENLVSVVSHFMGKLGVDLPSLDFDSYIAQLGDYSNIVGYLGFGQCLQIIISALITRLIINSIPFLKV